MIKRKTVLVLGAGSSIAYGLPTGRELKRRILGMSEQQLAELPMPPGAVRELGLERLFLECFRRSAVPSIDAFLASRPDFMDLGRAAIAAVLLPMESLPDLLDAEPDDHWYQYLTEALHAPWDQLHENQLAVVTFNYDRSLEVFLETTLSHRHKKPIGEVREKLKAIPIIHVYGSLGSLNRAAGNHVPYGCHDRGCIELAASSLVVIDEGRNNSPEFTRARELIADAQVLAFLGFGFDSTNVQRLGGQGIGAGGRVLQHGIQHRTFKGTAFGLTPAERRRAAISINHPQLNDPYVADHLEDRACLDLLRHTLIF